MQKSRKKKMLSVSVTERHLCQPVNYELKTDYFVPLTSDSTTPVENFNGVELPAGETLM